MLQAVLAGKQIVDTIVKILLTLAIATILIAILPISPFQAIFDTMSELPYISYFNWFFPVGRCLTALTAWGACMGIWYGISWIFRQLDIIGS
jgi:hypothetical protein